MQRHIIDAGIMLLLWPIFCSNLANQKVFSRRVNQSDQVFDACFHLLAVDEHSGGLLFF